MTQASIRQGSAEDRAVALLARLVGYDTVSRHSNLPLVDFAAEWLEDHGASVSRVPSPAGDKANVWARIGPDVPGGVVLSGHTDVVPVDGQAWSSDPFRLREEGGRLYGRGSCDMKGFLAAMFSVLPELRAERLRRPLYFALSYDEEVGCQGAPSMIRELAALEAPPGTVVVGEPTGMRLADVHKGICVVRTHVTGKVAHSSQTHRGASAVMLAGQLVAWLAERADRLAAEAHPGLGLEPPWSTLSVNTIHGGTALNILAGDCTFEWEIRSLPEQDPESVLADFRAACRRVERDWAGRVPEVGIRTEVLANVPGLAPEADGAAAALAAALLDRAEPVGVPFCTEAGQFQGAGMSAVVCGPGSVDQAHQPDEYLERSELERAVRFGRDLIGRLADG